jgi:signal transduction histidine kinase
MGRASLLQRAVARAEGRVGPDFSDGLQSIEESTNQLVRLINEMLDVTRLRMGQTVELDLGPADLVRIASRLASEYQNMSPRHTIRLETDLTRLLGDWDEARIERVVSNLLSNSVKYSPHGGDIRIGAAREEHDGGDWAVLTVTDWGLGIPESDVERVFEPYYRGSNVAGTTSGTGVGLAGTLHIVEQHGGVIEVESTPGAATTFIVRLPLIRDDVDLADL